MEGFLQNVSHSAKKVLRARIGQMLMRSISGLDNRVRDVRLPLCLIEIH
jgi:hypothetical protein